jgi:hypothetical protein
MKIEVIVSSHFPPFTPSLSSSPSQQELFLVSLLCGANYGEIFKFAPNKYSVIKIM